MGINAKLQDPRFHLLRHSFFGCRPLQLPFSRLRRLFRFSSSRICSANEEQNGNYNKDKDSGSNSQLLFLTRWQQEGNANTFAISMADAHKNTCHFMRYATPPSITCVYAEKGVLNFENII